MIRKGYYGIYKGEEYKVIKDRDNNFLIVTEGISKIDSAFVEHMEEGFFSAQVMLN